MLTHVNPNFDAKSNEMHPDCAQIPMSRLVEFTLAMLPNERAKKLPAEQGRAGAIARAKVSKGYKAHSIPFHLVTYTKMQLFVYHTRL